MRYLGNKAGFITAKALIWLLVLFGALYGAYKFAPSYFGYWMLKTEVQEEAKNAHMYADDKIADHIMQRAAAWSVPLDNDNLIIDRGQEDIKIDIHYTVKLDFFGRYQRELAYDINVRQPLREKDGSLR